VLVSYGAMSRKPMMVNPGMLIYRKQTIRSFWLHFWYQSAMPEEITEIFDRLAPMVADGTISAPVAATFGFDQTKEAITQAAQSRGKVLFRPDA
jgi:NADPH:quinone reductase-like Zn-dependent oxidoreductase